MFLKNLFTFLKQRKKMWLLPAIILLLIIGVMIIAGSSALAPFIYTIF